MTRADVGFAVLYRWRIRPDKEEQFLRAWEEMTKLLMEKRGALGSRLHRAGGGVWAGYAQWPSRDAWESSSRLGTPDAKTSTAMAEAIVESLDPVLMTPVVDHLVP